MPSNCRTRAARVGFDWPVIDHVFDKLAEETAELKAEIADGNAENVFEEMGDLLFVYANLARTSMLIRRRPACGERQFTRRQSCRA